MKIGMRTPSFKKSFKARTTGKMKRQVKRAVNPLYGKKGMGWVNNPKKAAYNKVYHKTTFGVNDVLRAASSVNGGKTKTSKVSYKASREVKQKKYVTRKDIKAMEKRFNVNVTKPLNNVMWCIFAAWVLIMTFSPMLILAALGVLIYAFIKMMKKDYRTASKWYYILRNYGAENYDKCWHYLNKLPEEAKQEEAYKNFIDVLNTATSSANNEAVTVKNVKAEVDSVEKADENYEKRLKVKDEKVNYSDKVHDEFIVIDTETTGLDCVENKIIEISAFKYKDGVILDSFEKLINPEIEIPEFITSINNITNEMVKNCETIDAVLPQLLEFIGEMPLIAHNAKFDIRFLDAYLAAMNKKITNEIIDTLTLSRLIYKDIENHKLETIKNYLNMDVKSHRASSDCKVCAQIYLDYCKEVAAKRCQDDLNESEAEALKAIKDMLTKSKRDITYLKAVKKGVYLDFMAFTPFLRVKLNGKKQYILTNMDNEVMARLGFEVQAPSKAENYKNRIDFESIDTLKKLEGYIIEEFDKCLQSAEEYKNSIKKGQSNIYKYLLS